MKEKEPHVRSGEEIYKSIDILNSLQDCTRFEQDRKNLEQIDLIYNRAQGDKPVIKHYSVEDLFHAVDFYYEHRDMEFVVNDAMMRPDGVVKVYSPRIGNEEERVVVSLKNYIVPQILEFAYMLLREKQLKNSQAAETT